MKLSIRKGFSFGLTSGIITTLGLMVGLNAGTHSKLAVLGGILIIAIADAFSDAMAIHISEEAEAKHTEKEIWESTLSTLFSKFIFAITFVVPVLLLSLSEAIMVSIVWGLSLIVVFSFHMARQQKAKPLNVVAEHLFIAILVIVITNYMGEEIGLRFGPI